MKNNSKIANAVTIKDVADYFGVSVRTIRSWMDKDKKFPKGFKKFGTLRFKKYDIEKYWSENSTKNRA